MSDRTISITEQRIVFDGELGKLRPHSHAVLALLVGVERKFQLKSEQGSGSCAVAIVPAGVEHELNFYGQRVLVVYVEPHDRSYAEFHRAAAGACLTLPKLTEPWRGAINTWKRRADSAPLLTLAREVFAAPSTTLLDRRVRVLADCFNRGQLLDAQSSVLAQRVRLSSSRLVHLVTTELGVGIRRLKQHYRFKQVARAAAAGENLTTAAHAAGFADSGHFSRAFLETFGLNPSKVLLRGS